QAFPELRLVGTDIRDVTAGHFFCDAAHRVPYCFHEGFDERIVQLCRQEQVDMIITGTDNEVVNPGELAARTTTIVGAAADAARIFVDKLQSFERFQERGIPFAPSCLPSEFVGQYETFVVKPREGRGSRGIHFDPPEPTMFDETFLVQERIVGQEITTAIYVN